MLRTLTTGIVIIALAVLAGTAMAGDYHMGVNLICSDCHSMHYSVQHDYAGGAPLELPAGGPHGYLLKAEANELCLSCHDGRDFAPDVAGDNTGAHVRQAGGLTIGAGHEDWKGHTLGSTDTAPGGTWAAEAPLGLECITCHSAHGRTSGATYPSGYARGQWRNLNPKVGTAAAGVAMTYAVGTNNTALAIFEGSDALGNIPAHYGIANVDFNEPDETKSAYADWCKSCHTSFHGAKGGAEVGGNATNSEWLRHPVADVNIGAQTGGHSKLTTWNKAGRANWVKVMSPSGDWGTHTLTNLTPSCFSCHKAHGNKNAFGLIYMSGTGAVSEEGDSAGTGVRDLCRQCHSQGEPPVPAT